MFSIDYKTLSDTSYVIFCYGLGVVEGYKHNGTVIKWKLQINFVYRPIKAEEDSGCILKNN